jgi:hypothetical protein
LDQDILADLFFAVVDHQLIIPIIEGGKIEDIVELVFAYALIEKYVVSFLDRDDHIPGGRIKGAKAEFHVLVHQLLKADLQVRDVGGVQHGLEVLIYNDLMMIVLGGSSVSGGREGEALLPFDAANIVRLYYPVVMQGLSFVNMKMARRMPGR